MNPAFLGKVERGILTINDRRSFDRHLETLDGDVAVTVGKRKRNRSDRQNRYYWGCVLKLMSEETGHAPEELHEAMKIRFRNKVVEIGGKVCVIPDTTTNMGTMEFSEFVERVRQVAAEELGLHVPDPNTYEAMI